MVKRRLPQGSIKNTIQPTEEQIEAFASAVDIPACEIKQTLDPNAKRDFKAIRVPFNEFEYTLLERVAHKTGRTKLNLIRWAIAQLAESENIHEGT